MANKLAQFNDVVTIEPNRDMVNNRYRNNNYTQLCGSVEQIQSLKESTYDVIICHNVLEYMLEREEVLSEFHRLLSHDGVLYS